MRKIIHVDADSFFASVEIRDNPKLRGRPIAVGGDPGRRGVLCTASYEARKFGVRSAMPSAHALRLCPELLIIKPNMARYKEASQAMAEIFSRFTDKVEPLSLDEAFLDVTDNTECRGSATWMATAIQKHMLNELGLPVSAGIAPVKFLAKIASDWRKPAGIFTIEPASVVAFAAQLPVRALPGVGAVTASRLHRHGLYTCEDVRAFGQHALVKSLGTFGAQLHGLAWGRGSSEVRTDRIRKSLSVEKTYDKDIGVKDLNRVAAYLAEELSARFDKLKPKYSPIKQFVKLKFADFSQTVLETAIPKCSDWPPTCYFERLLHSAWLRERRPVRLAGLGVRLNCKGGPGSGHQHFEQIPLF